jgi:ABC-type nitrate/sulfonate/bicarbonate transport system permease component
MADSNSATRVKRAPPRTAATTRLGLHALAAVGAGTRRGADRDLVIALGAWELGSGRVLPKYWFSSPSAIALKLWSWIRRRIVVVAPRLDADRNGPGYVIGCVAGIGSA